MKLRNPSEVDGLHFPTLDLSVGPGEEITVKAKDDADALIAAGLVEVTTEKKDTP